MFSAYFPRFLGVRQVRKILGVFEVFLGIFEKTKEKKDRGGLSPPFKNGVSGRSFCRADSEGHPHANAAPQELWSGERA